MHGCFYLYGKSHFMSSTSAIAIKNATDLWFKQLSRVSAIFDASTDAQLEAEIAPGRNSGYYLLETSDCCT